MSSGKQLLMRRPQLNDLARIVMPGSYQLRTYQPGDEQIWLDLCNPGIGMDWSLEKLHLKLLDLPFFTPERLFFITHADQPVGTACAWQQDAEETVTGYVHMVVVTPDQQGRGLGRALTLRVLHYFRDHGYREAILNTDDFRLPAITLYQDLGFERVIQAGDEAMRQRWEAIDRQLAQRVKKGERDE